MKIIDVGSTELSKLKLRFIISGLLALAAAVGLSVVWNRSIKMELATQATSFIRKGVMSTDMRGVVESISGIQLSSFESVTLYSPSGERILTLPPRINFKAEMRSWTRPLLFETIATAVFSDNEHRDGKLATLVFSYPRFELAWYAIAVWVLIAGWLGILMTQARKKALNEIRNEMRIRHAESLEQLTNKIRHNIYSPLAALRAIFFENAINPNTFLEQGQRATVRLEEIVSEMKADLLETTQVKKSKNRAVFEVSSVVTDIVSEKRLTSKGVEFYLECDGLDRAVYAELPAAELKSTLSNIINNSIEASNGNGTIHVSLQVDADSIVIVVKDNGCGIPYEIIDRVYDERFTFGKKAGTGVGLYYAKRLVDEFQGNIGITSEVGKGATVTLSFQRVATPVWHIDTLDLTKTDQIFICDDRPEIRMTWLNRLESHARAKSFEILQFSSCEEMTSSIHIAGENSIYLGDYDLGPKRQNGLDFARGLQDAKSFILVTGSFDDSHIQEACANLGCKLMSKNHISQITLL